MKNFEYELVYIPVDIIISFKISYVSMLILGPVCAGVVGSKMLLDIVFLVIL